MKMGFEVFAESKPGLDERDQELLEDRIVARRRISEGRATPLQGDLLRYPDGWTRRVAHVWHWANETPSAQPASWGGIGSHYVSEDGFSSYSGGLNRAISAEHLSPTDEWKEADFWFFSHERHTAHNGVDVRIPVRVWDVDFMDTEPRKAP